MIQEIKVKYYLDIILILLIPFIIAINIVFNIKLDNSIINKEFAYLVIIMITMGVYSSIFILFTIKISNLNNIISKDFNEIILNNDNLFFFIKTNYQHKVCYFHNIIVKDFNKWIKSYNKNIIAKIEQENKECDDYFKLYGIKIC